MKLLLDTHVLLWRHNEPSRLSETAHDAIRDFDNEILLSPNIGQHDERAQTPRFHFLYIDAEQHKVGKANTQKSRITHLIFALGSSS